jgi:hypothetical protein
MVVFSVYSLKDTKDKSGFMAAALEPAQAGPASSTAFTAVAAAGARQLAERATRPVGGKSQRHVVVAQPVGQAWETDSFHGGEEPCWW